MSESTWESRAWLIAKGEPRNLYPRYFGHQTSGFEARNLDGSANQETVDFYGKVNMLFCSLR